jgi:hypothetical protein
MRQIARPILRFQRRISAVSAQVDKLCVLARRVAGCQQTTSEESICRTGVVR